MELSIILAYYRNQNNLELILKALSRQSFHNFELVVAEDDKNPDTHQFLESVRENYPFPILHVDHEEKKGFRKTRALNKAIKVSTGKTLVFIDGDCIPHRHFARQYYRHSDEGVFLAGRRVLLGPVISTKIRSGRNLHQLSGLGLLLSDSKLKKEGLYLPFMRLHLKQKRLSGCNWGIRRSDILKVNGFDQDYERPGVGEDHDIEWRLLASGMRKKAMKNRAIVYHLHHRKNSSAEDAKANNALMEEKKARARLAPDNGLELKPRSV